VERSDSMFGIWRKLPDGDQPTSLEQCLMAEASSDNFPECGCKVRGRRKTWTESLLFHASTRLINFNFIIKLITLKCHGCVAEAVSALPGALVRWLVDCFMCVPCAPFWHVGGAGFAPPHNTHSKRSMQIVWEGRPQRTHLPTEGHRYTASSAATTTGATAGV